MLGAIVLAGTSLLTAGSAVGAGLMDSFVVTEFGIDRPRSVPRRRSGACRPDGWWCSTSPCRSSSRSGRCWAQLPGLSRSPCSAWRAPLLVRGDLGVREAMARSVDLTRRHLLVTVVVVTLPVVLEHEILDALDILWDFPFVVLFGAHIADGGVGARAGGAVRDLRSRSHCFKSRRVTMSTRNLYLYEVVDVVGQGQYAYMEHLWQDPVLRMPEMFGLQGSFYVCAAAGGRWPQVDQHLGRRRQGLARDGRRTSTA